MARKLPAVHADGMTVQLTPNQFMLYKMGKKAGATQPQGGAQLIRRCGHFSLGVYGIRYPQGSSTYVGRATDLVAMREYEDLGESAEQLQALDDTDLPLGKGKGWGMQWARDGLRKCNEMEDILADLRGRHPLDAELRADIAALRDIYTAHLSK